MMVGQSTSGRSGNGASRSRVLVVDDSAEIAELLTVTLSLHDYHVINAGDGKAAIDTAVREDPDLILLDVSLPDLDGFEVCRILKREPITEHTPIIFLTARSRFEDKIQGLDLGASDFITKPFQIGELLARVRAALRTKSLQDSLRQTNAELMEQANTDPLTGLYNRRYFDNRITQEVARAHRFGYPLSCAMLDIDHFKVVNDTFKHIWGDRVLVSLAELLRHNTREIDVVARYGGEEFVVLLIQADETGAISVAEKIRQAVLGHSFGSPGPDVVLNLTVSCGVSTLDAERSDAIELVHSADMALYRAKRLGRNRVCATQIVQEGSVE